MNRLEGKVAVITGGAGGIGKVAGKMFVNEGADVLLVDLDEDALKSACNEIAVIKSVIVWLMSPIARITRK